MTISTQDLLTVVRDFVNREQGVPTDGIAVDTSLFQEGYIDSFAVVRLIAELEGRLGTNLPPGSLIPEDFASVKTLEERLAQL